MAAPASGTLPALPALPPLAFLAEPEAPDVVEDKAARVSLLRSSRAAQRAEFERRRDLEAQSRRAELERWGERRRLEHEAASQEWEGIRAELYRQSCEQRADAKAAAAAATERVASERQQGADAVRRQKHEVFTRSLQLLADASQLEREEVVRASEAMNRALRDLFPDRAAREWAKLWRAADVEGTGQIGLEAFSRLALETLRHVT